MKVVVSPAEKGCVCVCVCACMRVWMDVQVYVQNKECK